MQKNIITYLYLFMALFILGACGQGITTSTIVDNDKTQSVNEEKEAEEVEELVEDKVEEIDEEEEPEIETEVVDEAETTEVKIEGPLSPMKVHFINVGQADAALIEFTDEGEDITMLIDTGNWNSSDVVNYLHSQDIKNIDIIAITHPHADHIGQLDRIIEGFDVSEVWMNGEAAASDVFVRALAAIENNDVGYEEPRVGDAFDLGQLEVDVIHPESLSGGVNDNSIVLHLQYGETSFLFTGDAESAAENEMLSRDSKLKADVLKVGHHGSNTSTTPSFLSAVNPEIAVYSAGEDSQYNHPDSDVVKRLEASGALVYGTDIHGTIIIETDGKKMTVTTNNQGTIKPPAPKDKPKKEPVKEKKPVATGSCVDINTADAAELQNIKHIGDVRVNLLIELRPYNSVEDLSRIKGIGPARIAEIIAQNVACIGG